MADGFDMKMRTAGEQVGRMWRDQDGFLGPLKPGERARRDPEGEFPTGPALGQQLGEVGGFTTDGSRCDVHEIRSGGPAVVVFFRSAVW
jgi:hypothetical protein